MADPTLIDPLKRIEISIVATGQKLTGDKKLDTYDIIEVDWELINSVWKKKDPEFRYSTPNQSTRSEIQRKENTSGYIYDKLIPELGDRFSLINGKYILRIANNRYDYYIYNSENKWTGYVFKFIGIDIVDGSTYLPKPKKNGVSPFSLIFYNGEYAFSLPKKYKLKEDTPFYTLIDNTYPKYLFEPTTNYTTNATVIDSKTGKPIKATVN
jgi:hypothetical protein